MISSGVHIRIDRRVDYSRKLLAEKTLQGAKKNSIYEENNKEIPIGFDFIEKIMICLCVNYSAWFFVLMVEISVKWL